MFALAFTSPCNMCELLYVRGSMLIYCVLCPARSPTRPLRKPSISIYSSSLSSPLTCTATTRRTPATCPPPSPRTGVRSMPHVTQWLTKIPSFQTGSLSCGMSVRVAYIPPRPRDRSDWQLVKVKTCLLVTDVQLFCLPGVSLYKMLCNGSDREKVLGSCHCNM